MKKVAILGGAFDPMHKGHKQMIWEVAHLNMFDEIWVMPCYKHIFYKQMSSANHRLEMCRIYVEHINSISPIPIIVSDFEIENNLLGKTYDILSILVNNYNDVQFSIIIGQDNADNILKWNNYKKIITEFSFIVIKRKANLPCIYKWYLNKPHIFIKHPIPDISSTMIRNKIKELNIIDKEYTLGYVADYVKKYRLYSYKKS